MGPDLSAPAPALWWADQRRLQPLVDRCLRWQHNELGGGAWIVPDGSTTAQTNAILACAGSGSRSSSRSASTYPGGLVVNNPGVTIDLNGATMGHGTPASRSTRTTPRSSTAHLTAPVPTPRTPASWSTQGSPTCGSTISRSGIGRLMGSTSTARYRSQDRQQLHPCQRQRRHRVHRHTHRHRPDYGNALRVNGGLASTTVA